MVTNDQISPLFLCSNTVWEKTMVFSPRMNTDGFGSAGMLTSTYFAVVLVNGRKLHPSRLLWLRSIEQSMSATQQLKKNCQTMAPSYEKSSDQTWVGWVATIPAQYKTPANFKNCLRTYVFKANIQELILRRIWITRNLHECIYFPLWSR